MVEIGQQHAISGQRQVLREMRGAGCFSDAAFEVHEGDHGQVLAGLALRLKAVVIGPFQEIPP
jgi:hypothetical protein